MREIRRTLTRTLPCERFEGSQQAAAPIGDLHVLASQDLSALDRTNQQEEVRMVNIRKEPG